MTVHGFNVASLTVGGDVTGSSVRWQRARGAGVVKALRSCFSQLNFLKVLVVLWRTQGGATLAMILPSRDQGTASKAV